jgi:hypothetical protein
MLLKYEGAFCVHGFFAAPASAKNKRRCAYCAKALKNCYANVWYVFGATHYGITAGTTRRGHDL